MPKAADQLIAPPATIQPAATATLRSRMVDLECLLGDMEGAIKTLQHVVYGLGEGEDAPGEVVHYLSDMLTGHMRALTAEFNAAVAATPGRPTSA